MSINSKNIKDPITSSFEDPSIQSGKNQAEKQINEFDKQIGIVSTEALKFDSSPLSDDSTVFNSYEMENITSEVVSEDDDIPPFSFDELRELLGNPDLDLESMSSEEIEKLVQEKLNEQNLENEEILKNLNEINNEKEKISQENKELIEQLKNINIVSDLDMERTTELTSQDLIEFNNKIISLIDDELELNSVLHEEEKLISELNYLNKEDADCDNQLIHQNTKFNKLDGKQEKYEKHLEEIQSKIKAHEKLEASTDNVEEKAKIKHILSNLRIAFGATQLKINKIKKKKDEVLQTISQIKEEKSLIQAQIELTKSKLNLVRSQIDNLKAKQEEEREKQIEEKNREDASIASDIKLKKSANTRDVNQNGAGVTGAGTRAHVQVARMVSGAVVESIIYESKRESLKKYKERDAIKQEREDRYKREDIKLERSHQAILDEQIKNERIAKQTRSK